MADPCASILISTEDGGKRATSVVESIVRKILGFLDPNFRSNRFQFVPSTDIAARSNAWKCCTTGGYNEKIKFYRALATQVAQSGPHGFVVVHIDADTVWAKRAKSQNWQRFTNDLLIGVRQQLQAPGTIQNIDALMARVIPMIPHYSIEAWLYQNSKVAADACLKRNNLEHARQVNAWKANRGALDEVYKPKETLCIGSRLNESLAQGGFPTSEVYNAGKSFSLIVDRFREANGLIGAMESTYR